MSDILESPLAKEIKKGSKSLEYLAHLSSHIKQESEKADNK